MLPNRWFIHICVFLSFYLVFVCACAILVHTLIEKLMIQIEHFSYPFHSVNIEDLYLYYPRLVYFILSGITRSVFACKQLSSFK